MLIFWFRGRADYVSVVALPKSNPQSAVIHELRWLHRASDVSSAERISSPTTLSKASGNQIAKHSPGSDSAVSRYRCRFALNES